MKSLLLIVVLFAMGYGQESNLPSTNPCDDPIYQQVVRMPLDSMSERQYIYFIERHEQCRDYEEKIAGNHPITIEELDGIMAGYTVSHISPCEDPIYKQLVIMPLDSMSERQYSYFTKRHEECREHERKITKRKAVTEKTAKIREHEKTRGGEDALQGVLWSLLAIALIAVIVIG